MICPERPVSVEGPSATFTISFVAKRSLGRGRPIRECGRAFGADPVAVREALVARA